MKKLVLLAAALAAFAACQKADKVAPKAIQIKDTVVTVKYDTIPDGGTINIRMNNDSTNSAGFQFIFNHTYHLAALSSEDFGTGLPGFGPTPPLLYALSSDGKDLLEDGVPYSHGMVVNLDATSPASGPFFIGAWGLFHIPGDIHIWVKDTYLKDSLDLRTGNYHFTIDNTNPSTYGKQRFQIVLR